MRRIASVVLAAILLAPFAPGQPKAIPVKVVVVAMFERGAYRRPTGAPVLGGARQARSHHSFSGAITICA
jgi:hypothetical protein